MQSTAPRPSGGGDVGWWASALRPYPSSSARIVAPRARAASSRSSTTTPAPSPITNPSRSRSKGRDAVNGSSARSDSAWAAANAVMTQGVSGASAPPQITTSALPSRSRRMPSPIALAPAAHAVETLMHGPRNPRRRLSAAAPAFGITMGTNSGLMRPLSAGFFTPRNSRAPSSAVSSPPKPVPITMPTRAGSTSPSAASASAASAAPSVNCVIRSARLASLFVSTESGSKSVTSQPKRIGASETSRCSTSRATPRPASSDAQNESSVEPAADTTPRPVIAIRDAPPSIR